MMVATYRVLPCLARDKLSLAGCTTALWGRGVPSQGAASSGPNRPWWGWCLGAAGAPRAWAGRAGSFSP